VQRFQGKSAVVTGGASGIGEGIVRRLVAEGGRCLVADLDDDRGGGLADHLGDAARFLRVDVSAEDDVIATVDTAVREFGPRDCLFSNAGVLGVTGSVIDTIREDRDRSIAVLLTSVFFGIKHGAWVMRAQGSGAIINAASTAGVRAGLGPHAYIAAEHGVVGLTESAGVELMPSGVRVNAIAPAATVSGMTARVVTGDPAAPGQVEEWLAERLGRAALPEDVAAAAVFLASDEACTSTAPASSSTPPAKCPATRRVATSGRRTREPEVAGPARTR
jgi:NAD(P)-dependent dehydrogenase (short-subunit alcohol dehydrogenase family)